MIGTFSFVLFLTMIKEAFEDYYRYKQDSEANAKNTSVYDYTAGNFVNTTWRDVRLGDIVLLRKDEMLPCDILLLWSDNPEGLAMVDTSNLDGETNLKEKLCPFVGIGREEVLKFEGRVNLDPPHPNLDSWSGELLTTEIIRPIHADVKSLLLRGTTLKNTKEAFGIAVYLGQKTKIMMNQKKPKGKVSAMMRLMNYILYSVFALQLLIILTFATLSVRWQRNNKEHTEYLGLGDDEVNASTWVIQFLTYWVTFSHMIPISLYVIIEMLKLSQAYLIGRDVEMRFEVTGNYSKCRNSDLIEELG